MPGVECEFACRCCLYDAFVHFQAREMGNKSKKNYVARRDVFKWTQRMDDAFINALIRQQRLGNRVDRVFTTAAYDNMVRELRENIGMPFEKDHLKNRLKTLKNNFKECFDIFNGANGCLEP